jgi:hypothetical protein
MIGVYTDEVDLLMSPKDISGIEIYDDQVPLQFARALSGCGAVVIWTK